VTLGLSRLPGETWLDALLRRAALAGVEFRARAAYHGRIAQGVSEEDAARNAAIECGCAEEEPDLSGVAVITP
jgi:hypothetical protein